MKVCDKNIFVLKKMLKYLIKINLKYLNKQYKYLKKKFNLLKSSLFSRN